MKRTATTRRGFLTAAVGALALPMLSRGQGFPVAGGSNLVCVTPGTLTGYVRQFDTLGSTIEQQLRQMYANGQRRMALVVPFYEGGDGFALDSSSGLLTTQHRANFKGLLSLMQRIGFLHVMVRFFPEWSADFHNWGNPSVMGPAGVHPWAPKSYGRNFSFMCDVWETANSVLFPWQVGLSPHPELIPAGTPDAILLKYATRLWDDLCCQYGPQNIGFDLIPTPDRIPNIGKVYANGVLPAIWTIDIYGGEPDFGWADTGETFNNFRSAMNAAGYGGRGYIWTEYYTGDPTATRVLETAGDNFWGYQWPIGRATVNSQQDRVPLVYLGPN